MKFEHTQVFNFEGAMRGMRNPMNSWEWGDTTTQFTTHIGENDMRLAQKLILAGSPHSKFLRQIMVSVDITAPMYFWTEFDTYKVGTVADSCSTMHKLLNTEITLENFEKPLTPMPLWQEYYIALQNAIDNLEYVRKSGAPNSLKIMKMLLPAAYLQKRTVTMNYQNLRNMYFQRRDHMLKEWNEDFINWIETLQYAKELITYEGEKQ